MTVSELAFGAHRSERLAENLALVDELLEIVTVLPFDTAAARRHAELKDILRRTGMPLAELDLQIASIALSRGLPLVTHNTAHFTAFRDWYWWTGWRSANRSLALPTIRSNQNSRIVPSGSETEKEKQQAVQKDAGKLALCKAMVAAIEADLVGEARSASGSNQIPGG